MNKKMTDFVDRLWRVETFYDMCSAMAEFVGVDRCEIRNKRDYFVLESTSGMLKRCSGPVEDFSFYHDSANYYFSPATYNFVYVSDGVPYFLETKVKASLEFHTAPGSKIPSVMMYTLESIEIGKWKKVTKLLSDTIFLHTEEELEEIAETYFKYAKEVVDETALGDFVDYRHIIMAPQIEQLWKAGYEALVSSLAYNTNYEQFNRATKKASKIKEIFKMPKYVYQLLKDEGNLSVWDTYRKISKVESITEEVLRDFYYGNWNEKDIERVRQILKRTYKERPVFSFHSLLNYIDRVDQFEAIDREEALTLLSDYLRMCEILDLRPRIDGDSLKREHDIAARLCRFRKDEKLNEAMKEPCRKLSKYNWSDGTFIIRAAEDYEDLIDEAKQQHSCVASYAQSIVKGTSAIFFMRRAAAPGKSLITVELAPDGSKIRQKLLAYNHKIRNKSQTDFLDAWAKHCKKVNLDELMAG